MTLLFQLFLFVVKANIAMEGKRKSVRVNYGKRTRNYSNLTSKAQRRTFKQNLCLRNRLWLHVTVVMTLLFLVVLLVVKANGKKEEKIKNEKRKKNKELFEPD